METAKVNFDEYTEVHGDEPIKRPEEYKSFVYFYEGMPIEEDSSNQVKIQQQVSVTVKSQIVNVKLHSDAKLQNEENAHSDSKISTHDKDVELLERNMPSSFFASNLPFLVSLRT